MKSPDLNDFIVRHPPPPTHLQWREALFPTDVLAIFVPKYAAGEAGLPGRLYNLVVTALLSISGVLNLVLIVPTFPIMLLWILITIPIMGPLQILAMAERLKPEQLRSVGKVVTFPAGVLTWLLYSPVKVLNFLTAIVVYCFGPKSATRHGG